MAEINFSKSTHDLQPCKRGFQHLAQPGWIRPPVNPRVQCGASHSACEDYLKAKIPGLREKPLAELDLYHRDITPNTHQLM